MKLTKLSLPPCGSLFVEVIRVSCVIGPDLSDEGFAISFHENIVVFTIVKGRIVGFGSVSDTCINNRHITHVFSMKALHELRKGPVVIPVVFEVSVITQVVNV